MKVEVVQEPERGVLLILMVLFLPRGLVPSATSWWERRWAARRKTALGTEAPARVVVEEGR